MSSFGEALRTRRTAAGLSQTELARRLHLDQSAISRYENGRQRPDAGTVAALVELLGALPAPTSDPVPAAEPSTAPATISAMDLVQRITASDVSTETLDLLDARFDDAATRYCAVAPATLAPVVNELLSHVHRLMDAPRLNLAAHHRLVRLGGWCALLRATLDVDVEDHPSAATWLRTAHSMADHVGDTELAGWSWETAAWQALNTNDTARAMSLIGRALDAAPAGGSAEVQATTQLARIHARLGNRDETHRYLDQADALSAHRGNPALGEHHYVYDPVKTESFRASALAWLGDPQAESAARDAVAVFGRTDDNGQRPRLRRWSSACMDLALVAARAGNLEVAVTAASDAIHSGEAAPSNYWRLQVVVDQVAGRGIPAGDQVARDYQRMLST